MQNDSRGFMLRSDTHPEIQARYDALWRSLTPQERFRRGLALIAFSRAMMLAGLRERFPDMPEKQLQQTLREQVYHLPT